MQLLNINKCLISHFYKSAIFLLKLTRIKKVFKDAHYKVVIKM